MADPDPLRTFVKDCLAAGFTVEETRAKVVEHGGDPSLVDQHLAAEHQDEIAVEQSRDDVARYLMQHQSFTGAVVAGR